MGKPALYVTARSGARLSRSEAEGAVELFLSTGKLDAAPESQVHVMNYCLEHGFGFSLRHIGAGCFVLERVR